MQRMYIAWLSSRDPCLKTTVRASSPCTNLCDYEAKSSANIFTTIFYIYRYLHIVQVHSNSFKKMFAQHDYI